MNQWWQWLMSQPDTVKAATFAAGVAMAGVILNNIVAIIGLYINNRVSQAKTAKELEHDREQKKRERDLTLRRDIYLGLAEYLQDCLFALSNFADLNLEHRDIVSSWRKAGHYAAKANFIGQENLLDALSTLNAAVNESVIKVRIKRNALSEYSATIDRKRASMQHHYDSSDLYSRALRQRDVDGTLKQPDIDRLVKKAASEIERANLLFKECTEMNEEFKKRHSLLVDLALTEQARLYPLLIPIAESVRKELGEAIDMAVYTRVMDRAKGMHDKDRLDAMFGVKPGAAG